MAALEPFASTPFPSTIKKFESVKRSQTQQKPEQSLPHLEAAFDETDEFAALVHDETADNMPCSPERVPRRLDFGTAAGSPALRDVGGQKRLKHFEDMNRTKILRKGDSGVTNGRHLRGNTEPFVIETRARSRRIETGRYAWKGYEQEDCSSDSPSGIEESDEDQDWWPGLVQPAESTIIRALSSEMDSDPETLTEPGNEKCGLWPSPSSMASYFVKMFVSADYLTQNTRSENLGQAFLRGKSVAGLAPLDVASAATTLVDYLELLDEPLLTTEHRDEFFRAAQQRTLQNVVAACQEAVERLPQNNQDTLSLVMVHLNRFLKHAENAATSSLLQKMFGKAVVAYTSNSAFKPSSAVRRDKLVMKALLVVPLYYWRRKIASTKDCQPVSDEETDAFSELLSDGDPTASPPKYYVPFSKFMGALEKENVICLKNYLSYLEEDHVPLGLLEYIMDDEQREKVRTRLKSYYL